MDDVIDYCTINYKIKKYYKFQAWACPLFTSISFSWILLRSSIPSGSSPSSILDSWSLLHGPQLTDGTNLNNNIQLNTVMTNLVTTNLVITTWIWQTWLQEICFGYNKRGCNKLGYIKLGHNNLCCNKPGYSKQAYKNKLCHNNFGFNKLTNDKNVYNVITKNITLPSCSV